MFLEHYYFYTVTFLLIGVSIANDRCINGKWSKGKATFFQGYAGTEKVDFDRWHDLSCPIESFEFNCFYRGAYNRSAIVNHRIYEFSDPECYLYEPYKFLSIARNRSITFLGDSVMGQVWTAVMCSLHMVTEIQYSNAWEFYQGFSAEINHHLCPTEGTQCLLLSGQAYLPTLGSTIKFLKVGRHKESTLSYVLSALKTTDFLVLNIGVHLNSESEATRDYMKVKDSLSEYFSTLQTLPPKVFFLETLPQHFVSTFGNAYYDQSIIASRRSTHCQRCVSDPSLDWRNNLAHEVLGNLGSNMSFINVAKALVDQGDAHIGCDDTDRNSIPCEYADCTHWCQSSGVFQYVVTKIYNAFL